MRIQDQQNHKERFILRDKKGQANLIALLVIMIILAFIIIKGIPGCGFGMGSGGKSGAGSKNRANSTVSQSKSNNSHSPAFPSSAQKKQQNNLLVIEILEDRYRIKNQDFYSPKEITDKYKNLKFIIKVQDEASYGIVSDLEKEFSEKGIHFIEK